MQDIHMTFPLDQLHLVVAAFETQFEAQRDAVTVLDFGASYKQEHGYLVLEWGDEVDPAFIDQLTADSQVTDFSIYNVPCTTDEPFRPLVFAQEGGLFR
jgi:hypothetical protein